CTKSRSIPLDPGEPSRIIQDTMAFNRGVQRKILRGEVTDEPLPCVMCGRVFPLPEATHIIDAKEWIAKVGADSPANGIPPSTGSMRNMKIPMGFFRNIFKELNSGNALSGPLVQLAPEDWAVVPQKSPIISNSSEPVGIPLVLSRFGGNIQTYQFGTLNFAER